MTRIPVKGRRTTAVIRLNRVWKFAIPPLSTTLSHIPPKAPAWRRRVMPIMNRTVPMQLNTIWTTPVRLASLEVPMEQTRAVVTQVPRLMPMIMG